MKNQHLKYLATSLILSLFFTITNAQSFNRARTPNDTLKSVRVNSAGEVTFQIYAPEAKNVSVSGDIGYGNSNVVKAENGVWSIKTSPLKQGVYRYSFLVDGVSVNDPKSAVVQDHKALLEVYGDGSGFWETKNVPHGDVRVVWYPSTATNSTRRMHIYTPPGYDKSNQQFPVLYLLHGGGDNDVAWPTVGRANFILDNLLADGKINPMVVVMPDASIGVETFTNDILNCIIPYVVNNYKVKTGKDNRALAGLSMGGLHTLNTGIANSDKFAYILPLSTGWFQNDDNMMKEAETLLKNNAAKCNKNVKLFWVAIGGQEDIAYQNCQNMLKLFDKYGLKYKYSDKPGGHTWYTWRDNLYDLTQMIFK